VKTGVHISKELVYCFFVLFWKKKSGTFRCHLYYRRPVAESVHVKVKALGKSSDDSLASAVVELVLKLINYII
jgi:hypothetical protein